MSETIMYRGFLAEHDYGEAMDVLFLTGVRGPLAEEIEDDIDSHGRYLTAAYFISDQEAEKEALLLEHVKRVSGVGDAKFHSHYSEITGYLWTDEELNVGGHDLLEELRSHVGKFCHLEITYSKESNQDTERA